LKTFLVDIDGTIIDQNENPLPNAIENLKKLKESGHKIILITRRGDEEWSPGSRYCRKKTLALLRTLSVPYDDIMWDCRSPRVIINDEVCEAINRNRNEPWDENFYKQHAP